ncbi:MAG: hypothetical protein UW64_C0016G0010 [Microgenomates group bacterium GW2011_GWC1_44_37]|uniref:Antitoxin SocA-like Panacea domain-containing protein n=1 Tax=Candidatus Collierbacteria bacterium GW2011_GWB2_44_22 TaxID=1618387 RepID=A0A0G1KTX1_9BACT|nr:MAG: hypothetical protein UW31_C0006G0068 [Candidatus Collierbacteria bacterium GW2011_GWA2_44_13]KKT50046.1 MAG: hypothetical protein UW42_C0025G0008 [Candidatus Collierbacteria bacterium GW2011_GWB1_44_197]KKT51349.1 MAG: hypothetical protein UW44_C0013G0069 [Candidatus Collierbacteria bacterium GW2011_GWB2_44_22]KKT61473.1 MAG: hypothetical protein UW56_C0025G0010 [Candidatus Collierbacteria bacterium GW2011_GWD1_44_27]KKT65630.1 MAG: hypothetical protein UW58_C0024G0009 [Candidatus Colli
MENKVIETANVIIPSDIAKYFLYRSFQDGDLVTPLKMQKLVYYAYVWTLVKNRTKLFNEKIEAWQSGPVAPSLYRELRGYGSSPIGEAFLGSREELNKSLAKFSTEIKNTLDGVYEQYMTKTAFELVALTHSEKPWLEARDGLAPTQSGSVSISDKTIVQSYGQGQ